MRSAGSHGVKGSATRSQSRRGTASSASAQGARRGEHRAEPARARSERVPADRKAEQSVGSKSSAKSGPEARAAPSKARDATPVPDARPEPPPARKKRVPPLLSGNKARSRSDKDSESDKPGSASSASTSKASPSTVNASATTEKRLKSPRAPDWKAPLDARPVPQSASRSSAAVPAVAEARLNADAAEFHPSSSAAHVAPVLQTLAGESTTATGDAPPSHVASVQSQSTANGQETAAGAGPGEPAADATAQATTMPSERAASRSSSQIESVKFNVDAPEFRPSSAATKAVHVSPVQAVEADQPVDNSDISETDAVKQLAGETDAKQSVPESASGPAEVSVPGEAAEGDIDDDDDDTEFVHSKVVLVGGDITADADETPDEKIAAQQLLEIAKELQRMGVPPAEAVFPRYSICVCSI